MKSTHLAGQKKWNRFIIPLLLLWAEPAIAGHIPSPPPAPGLGPDMSAPHLRDGSGGGSGIIPVYPVTGAQHQLPLEAIVDAASRQYEIGESTWAHEWADVDPDNFLLPHLALSRSREIIQLADKVFKNFDQGDVGALGTCGNPILPLLLEPLKLPGFPEGYSAIEESLVNHVASNLISQRRTRGQAFDLLLGLSGQVKEPYRYLGLVDVDETIRSKAFRSFAEAKGSEKAELAPLLLLSAYHREAVLADTLKEALGSGGGDAWQKIVALQKTVKKSDLLRTLRDNRLPLEALAVGLEMLEVPSLRGDESKSRRAILSKELKEIQEAISIQAKRLEKIQDKTTLAHMLILGIQAKFGEPDVAQKILALSRDSRWWVRLLCARAGADLWETRLLATPVLLERQRDWVYEVRRKANTSLQFLHRVPMTLKSPPSLQIDSFIIDLWEKWWLSRQQISGLDSEEGWQTIELQPGKGKVYSPAGLAEHPYLEGTYKSTKLFIIDHNENGEYDYGIDNFATKNVKEPGTFLSQLANISGKYYFLRMIPDKLQLQLKPYDGSLGTVSVKEKYDSGTGLDFLVLSKSPDVTIQLDRAQSGKSIQVEVPAGDYAVYAGRVVRLKGGSSHVAHLAPGLNRQLHVSADGVVDLRLGQSLWINADIKFTGGPERKTMRLELSNPQVHGAYGEMYFNLDPQLNDLKITIKRLDGKILQAIEWRKEGYFDGSDEEKAAAVEADSLKAFEMQELQKAIAEGLAAVANLNIILRSGPPYPEGTTLEGMQDLLQQWQSKLGLWQGQLALLQVTNRVASQMVEAFNAVSIPLVKMPEEFLLEITGSTFFGPLEPTNLQIKGNDEAPAQDN